MINKLRISLILFFIFFINIICSQEIKIKPIEKMNEKSKEVKSIDTVKVSIETAIDFSSSSNDTRKESSSGIGTLGLKFERGYIYCDVNFTVYTQNKQIISVDSTETKIFGTNLLLPQNSSSNKTNFYILLGAKSFYKKVDDNEPTISIKRFGVNGSFRVNNTTWIKDSLQSPVTINTFEINLTYMLMNTELFNTKEKIKLMLSYGLTARRIGGDLGLDSNKALRKEFLNTEQLGFNGTNLGVRLEISKFYGQMNLNSFNRSQNINGFSGNQAIISLGLRADLLLTGKEVDPKREKIKELEKELEIKKLENEIKKEEEKK